MNEIQTTCPQCGYEFDVSSALSERIRSEAAAALKAEYEAREKASVRQAEARLQATFLQQITDLRQQLAEQQQRAEESRRKELELLRKTRALEEARQNLELELEQRLAGERERIARGLREQMDELYQLRLKEKEQQIDDLRKALEEAARRSRQGSQERQGEVLEAEIELLLAQQFPEDNIQPVRRGIRGGDILQTVAGPGGSPCGSILWELKNTRRFQPAWIQKLKADQREVGADLAVIISVTLPEEVQGFGLVQGVWVTDLRCWAAVAVALREQLVQVGFARAAAESRDQKMEILYRYLSGNEFRTRVEAVVEAFTALQEQLERERRAMERLWAERDRQLKAIVRHTAGMYGDIRGLIGGAMPVIQALSLEAPLLAEVSEG
ncbi:MAG: DUF2130 domain-containing protein [Acidobacteriota bacterium]